MPVSFYGDVTPIFAMHCNGCHGEAGGLNLRSYRELMRGGNSGKTLIAGDAENSLIIQFVEGRRGEAHRMPIGGRPLTPRQIETLRRWIDEGARADDPGRAIKWATRRESVRIPIQIQCRVNTSAYLTVAVVHPVTGATLWSQTASVKSPPEQNDAGPPGKWLTWKVRPEVEWPGIVDVKLSVEHASAPAESVEIRIEPL